MAEIILEQISYLKVARPSTLNQYLVRRFMGEEADKNAKVKGVVKVDNKLMPKSAREIQKLMKGMTSEKVLKLHPEWKDDYPAYIEEWHEKQREKNSTH